jgi:hypothetical protein
MGHQIPPGRPRMNAVIQNAAEKCRLIGQRNGLDPDDVNLFIANHTSGDGLVALNARTLEVEPIRTGKQLERLLVKFCVARQSQPD